MSRRAAKGLAAAALTAAVAAWTTPILLGSGCGRPAEGAPAVAPDHRPLPAPVSAGFTDVAARAGIDLVTACGNREKNHLLEVNGSGVALADYDNDGDEDIYIATAQTTDDWLAGRRPRANALYRNEGGLRFVEVAAGAGVALRAWSNGAYFVDFDNDGRKDLFVTTWGPNVLYRNNGDGTFTDVTARARVAGAPEAWSTSAAFSDLDGDGDLDLYVANYCAYDLRHPPFGGRKAPWKGVMTLRGPIGFTGQADVLYRNNGDGTFTDVTKAAGVDEGAQPLYGMGVVIADLDGDGSPDIYVANDSCPNTLWRNKGNLRFIDIGLASGTATSADGVLQAGMGVDAADFDGDGRLDLFVTNFAADWNTLYRSRGDTVFGPGSLCFDDATFEAGLRDSYLNLSWGTRFFDFDNDGWLDLFVANGHIYPEVDRHPELGMTYRQANSLYHNRGDGTFENISSRAGDGLAIVESTRGLALGDLDRDGDLDVVLTNIDAAPNLLVNEGGNRRSWVSIRLVGRRSNREGIGARLVLEANGRRQIREINPFGSFQSCSVAGAHIGLDRAAIIDRLTIRWPGGGTEFLEHLPVGRFLTITEGNGVTAAEQPVLHPKDQAENLATREGTSRAGRVIGTPSKKPALDALWRAAEHEPRSPKLWRAVGEACHASGDFEGELRALREALVLDPTDEPTLLTLVQLQKISGGGPELEKLLRDGLTRLPNSADLHYELGHQALSQGRLKEAENKLRQAVSLDPILWQAHHDLARIQEGTGRRDQATWEKRVTNELRAYSDKEKILRDHLDALSNNGAAVLCLAELALTRRRFPEALERFTRAESLGADRQRASAGRAEACFESGDDTAGAVALAGTSGRTARADLARAAALSSAGKDPTSTLASLLAKAGDEHDILLRAFTLAARTGHTDLATSFLTRAAEAVPKSTCGRLVTSPPPP